MSLPFQPGQRSRETADEAWQNQGLDDKEPWLYEPDPGLVDAANVALLLGKPLLLTGEPGCGKTSFASALAWELFNRPPLKFETRSTSSARDLFYHFDALGMFQAAYVNRSAQEQVAAIDYLSFNALGQAILEVATAADPTLVERYPPREEGAVVLIDEVDKAPRDFPNDILNELERMYFKVPELNRAGKDPVRVQADESRKPVVVITSNSDKQLPPAFMRRCVYYHVPFPERDERDRLTRIITKRVGRPRPGRFTRKKPLVLAEDAPLLQDGLSQFYKLRVDTMIKKPTTGELIEWFDALLDRGANPLRPPSRELVSTTLAALVKNQEDLVLAPDLLWADA